MEAVVDDRDWQRERYGQGAHGASTCLSTAGAGKVNVTFEFCRSLLAYPVYTYIHQC
jgi:hypothetical protein